MSKRILSRMSGALSKASDTYAATSVSYAPARVAIELEAFSCIAASPLRAISVGSVHSGPCGVM